MKDINIIVKYAGILDLIITKVYIAREFRYSCPNVVEKSENLFEAKQVRHPLIEHINKDDLVPNDISLGNGDTNGVLLYDKCCW